MKNFALALLFGLLGYASAEELPSFDFREKAVVAQWRAEHDIAQMQATSAGMRIVVDGDDPYCSGPPVDLPEGRKLLLFAEIESRAGGMCEVFYFDKDKGPGQDRAIRFHLPAGRMTNVSIPLPSLGKGTRLRLDPPASGGEFILRRLWFEPLPEITPPVWLKPTVPEFTDADPLLKAAGVEFRHAKEWGGFEVRCDGKSLACGFNRPLIGYLHGSEVRWLDVKKLAEVTVQKVKNDIRVDAKFRDPDGGEWNLTGYFLISEEGTVHSGIRCGIPKDRRVVFLPLLLLTPGLGSTGELKNQALFAGVEYLENEPSSSRADIETPLANRRVPESHKITIPLMGVQTDEHYVGLSWQMTDDVCALFDSPDRIFGGGSHAMGVILPGTKQGRIDGEILPYTPHSYRDEVTLSATIFAGRGRSVVPLIRHYVQTYHPKTARKKVSLEESYISRDEYRALAAKGWLDSPIREGAKVRHAVLGKQFAAQPAADAAWQMLHLAQGDDATRKEELTTVAREAIAAVPIEQRLTANVGHVRYPVAPLVFGDVEANRRQAAETAKSILRRFESDGTLRYKPIPGREDYGRTHWSNQANGHTAQAVDQFLEFACFSGEPKLIEEGIRLVRALHRWDDTVPRGAQTWEIPLHTPDVLASAYLVRAFVRGYELTGDERFLASAKYWAWTGVPFVYLRKPASGVGEGATIAVLGATNWQAPLWIGLPVQWCGLVYADALYRLEPYDKEGPWKQLADGIARSGMEQVYPTEHPHAGLLPDSFSLREQVRNPADINPGTLQPVALRSFGIAPPYEFHVLRDPRILIHAPGRVLNLKREGDRITFQVDGWSPDPYCLLLHGFAKPPRVTIDGQAVELIGTHTFSPDTGSLVLRLRGKQDVELHTAN